MDITYISTQHQSIQFPTSNFEAVESAKANAAACRKAPLESPKMIQQFRIRKVLKGLQFCSKDMFGFFLQTSCRCWKNLRDRLELLQVAS